MFSNEIQKIKIRKDEQKNEKVENLMEPCIRPHRNRTRAYGIYKRLRAAWSFDRCSYWLVCMGNRIFSCAIRDRQAQRS